MQKPGSTAVALCPLIQSGEEKSGSRSREVRYPEGAGHKIACYTRQTFILTDMFLRKRKLSGLRKTQKSATRQSK
jgi:hypothetical protein